MRTIAGKSDVGVRKILRTSYDDITETFEVKDVDMRGDDKTRNLKVVYIEMESQNFNHLFVANDKQNDKTFIFEVDRKHRDLNTKEHQAILKSRGITEATEATIEDWFLSFKGFRFIGAYDNFFEIPPISPKKKATHKKVTKKKSRKKRKNNAI